jgi:hypothetical protein
VATQVNPDDVLRAAGFELTEPGQIPDRGLCCVVSFHGQNGEGFRAFGAAQAAGLDVKGLSRSWSVRDGELVGPQWELFVQTQDHRDAESRRQELCGSIWRDAGKWADDLLEFCPRGTEKLVLRSAFEGAIKMGVMRGWKLAGEHMAKLIEASFPDEWPEGQGVPPPKVVAAALRSNLAATMEQMP